MQKLISCIFSIEFVITPGYEVLVSNYVFFFDTVIFFSQENLKPDNLDLKNFF